MNVRGMTLEELGVTLRPVAAPARKRLRYGEAERIAGDLLLLPPMTLVVVNGSACSATAIVSACRRAGFVAEVRSVDGRFAVLRGRAIGTDPEPVRPREIEDAIGLERYCAAPDQRRRIAAGSVELVVCGGGYFLRATAHTT